ncbi:hypothetical protein VPH49_21945 [Pseudomonas luteola]|uniref:hypothetical protein n=1 Tax=Pseudomonas luteola TaxID=47886 RepID=UPI003A8A89D9
MTLEIDDGTPSSGMDLGDLDVSSLDLGDSFDTPDDEPEIETDVEENDEAADEGTESDAESDDPASAGADADVDTDGGDEQSESTEPEQEGEATDSKKPAKDPLIPKARLDQALRRGRVAEQRAQELEAEIAELRRLQAEAAAPKPVSPEEVQDLFKRANEALVDGRVEDAAALQAEAFKALAPQSAPAAQPDNTTPIDPIDALEARLEFKSTIKDIYERFPEFDENGDTFDEELSREALDLTDMYTRRGYTTAEAVRKAAEGVAKLHDLSDRKAAKAEKPAAKVLQEAKTRDKVNKAVNAPPVGKGKARAEGTERLDPARMSEKELMALPASVLNKLLGNAI